MPIDIFSLFWLFLIISALLPALQRRWLEMQRQGLIRRFEKKRGSRLITLIHRQEALSFLGIAFSRYIDIEDSE